MLCFDINIPRLKSATKILIVLDRKKAERITLNSLAQAKNSLTFMKAINKKLKRTGYSVNKTVKIKPRKTELLNRLLEVTEEASDLKKIIQEHWREKIEDCERNRYSQYLKEAFDFLKKVYKYHEYKRRDGSIITKVYGQDGSIITDPDEVNTAIMNHIRSMQIKDTEPKFTEPLAFPPLPDLTTEEMLSLIERLSTNKALAFDGVSDILFQEPYKAEAAEKLKDI